MRARHTRQRGNTNADSVGNKLLSKPQAAVSSPLWAPAGFPHAAPRQAEESCLLALLTFGCLTFNTSHTRSGSLCHTHTREYTRWKNSTHGLFLFAFVLQTHFWDDGCFSAPLSLTFRLSQQLWWGGNRYVSRCTACDMYVTEERGCLTPRVWLQCSVNALMALSIQTAFPVADYNKSTRFVLDFWI